MTNEQEVNLIDAALAARTHAHAPYSQFALGAAILTSTGEMFAGCNIENASYGLTNCAERTALFAAVAAGHRSFLGLALASPGVNARRKSRAEPNAIASKPMEAINATRLERTMGSSSTT